MAVSPYTPVNSINWEIRDLSNQQVWRSSKGKENGVPTPADQKHRSVQPLAPRIKQCRDDMRKLIGIVAEENNERICMRQQLLDAERRAADDRRRINELELLVSQSLNSRGTPALTSGVPESWQKEKEDLFLQLGEFKREKAQQEEAYSHVQSRLEAKTDDLHRQKEAQAEEIQRLRAQLEEAAQKDATRVKQIDNLQRLQRRATRDRNEVLETLEAGLDEARNEAAACRKQMDEVLHATEQQILEAEVRGRDAQLKELRALSPRAMLQFLTMPQQQQQHRSGVWGWLGGT